MRCRFPVSVMLGVSFFASIVPSQCAAATRLSQMLENVHYQAAFLVIGWAFLYFLVIGILFTQLLGRGWWPKDALGLAWAVFSLLNAGLVLLLFWKNLADRTRPMQIPTLGRGLVVVVFVAMACVTSRFVRSTHRG